MVQVLLDDINMENLIMHLGTMRLAIMTVAVDIADYLNYTFHCNFYCMLVKLEMALMQSSML